MTEVFNAVDDVIRSKVEVSEDGKQIKVGEKQFDTVQALAESKAHADQHIALIERENAQLKRMVQEKGEQLDFLAKVEDTLKTTVRPQTNQDVVNVTKDELRKDIQPDKVREIVRQEISGAQSKQAGEKLLHDIKDNIVRIREALIEDAGGNAELAKETYTRFKKSGVFNQKAHDVMLAESPDALLSMIRAHGSERNETTMSIGQSQRFSPTTTQNTAALVKGAKPYSHFAKILRANPNLYYAVETQREIKQAAAAYSAAGKDFFSS